MNKIIFLWWIHWVWKTSIWDEISKDLNIKHITASKILENHISYNKDIKKEKDFYNESKLIIKEFQKELSDDLILFDAHFVLNDSCYNLIKVKKEIFKWLNLKSIIILIDKVENIRERLKKRDNKAYDLEFLEDLQKQEIDYSKEIANVLKIEHKIFDISKLWFEITKVEIINYIKTLC